MEPYKTINDRLTKEQKEDKISFEQEAYFLATGTTIPSHLREQYQLDVEVNTLSQQLYPSRDA